MTPIFNADIFTSCYTKQLLTQLCCGNGILHETIIFSTFKQQCCRFFNHFQKAATCCRNGMLRQKSPSAPSYTISILTQQCRVKNRRWNRLVWHQLKSMSIRKPGRRCRYNSINHRFRSNLTQMLGRVSEWLWQKKKFKIFCSLQVRETTWH